MDLQHAMRSLVRGIPRLAFGGVPAERAGDSRLAWRRLRLRPSPGFRVLSDFAEDDPIPFAHSADGGSFAPPVMWSGVPAHARSLVLLVEDPDAPTPNPFLHWLVYGIPPQAQSVGAALAGGASEGRNSMLRSGWTGCAPPRGDRAHRYFFELFALDQVPRLPARAGRSAVLGEMAGHVLGFGVLTGTYRR